MITRRSLLRTVGATAALQLAAPPIITAVRRKFFPGYGRFRFKEVAENVFVVERPFVGFEWMDEVLGVRTANATWPPTPNDPEYTSGPQWYLDSSHLDAIGAWSTCQGDSGTVICNMDTGVTLGSDTPTNTVTGFNELLGNTNTADTFGHGSQTAAIIDAAANSYGSIGVAPNCTFMPIVVADSSGNFTDANLAAGITFAYGNGVHIISMSLSGAQATGVVQTAVAAAWAAGCSMAADTGDISVFSTTFYPCAFPNVVGIAGLDSADNLWVDTGVTMGSGGKGSGVWLSTSNGILSRSDSIDE